MTKTLDALKAALEKARAIELAEDTYDGSPHREVWAPEVILDCQELLYAYAEALIAVAEAAQRHVDEARFGGSVTTGFSDLRTALATLHNNDAPNSGEAG